MDREELAEVMLSISRMRAGQEDYYAGLAKEDYYLDGGEPPGQWFGGGAKALGLEGVLDNEQFRALYAGFLEGKPLVQNAGKETRCPGWDLTFSAPKTVSVLWSQVDKEIGDEIRASHLEAVEKALAYLEDNCGFTRRGKGGCEYEKAKLVFATFEHGTSRAQDPQLHTHALLLNAGLREDGSTGTLSTREVYQHKMAAGALYRAELAYQLDRRLDLEAERDGRCFQIKGVSKELADVFSKRRTEIEERLAELGATGAVASERMALLTRSNKAHLPREQLGEQWSGVGQQHGWSFEQAQELIGAPQADRAISRNRAALESAAEAAIEITRQASTFTERDIVRVTAEMAQTEAVGADRVRENVREYLSNAPEIVALGLGARGELHFTTQEMLDLEKGILNRAERMGGKRFNQVDEEALGKVFESRPTITEEQRIAVEHIARGEGTIKLVSGDAGTGKTYMLDAAREALESGGFRVVGAALAGKAAKGLEEGSGIPSGTLHSLLYSLENGRRHLDEKTVVVVDEVGMVGTRQMADLVENIERAKASLVLVGDAKQLQAIEAGGALNALWEQHGGARLSEIIRQQDPADREAVRAMSQGRAHEALSHYAAKGNLKVAPDHYAAKEGLLAHWREAKGFAHPEDHLIMAGTRLDVTILNREIQKERLEEGLLGDAFVEVGNERIYRGDRVLFTMKKTSMGIDNGDLATATGVIPELGLLTVRLDSGEERTLSVEDYDHLQPGYAVTTHKAQGMTAKNTYVLTHEGMQDRELSYVQASRAKLETYIFTTEIEAGDDLADLVRSMERSRPKEFAHAIQTQLDEIAQEPTLDEELGMEID